MCLIVFALDAHPRHRLVLAANRDEYHARPAAPLGWWDDAPRVLAGRDLEQGGTWLGVTRDGRFAAVTNFRGASTPPGARSRGLLAAEFLRGDGDAAGYAAWVHARRDQYAGFSLLVGDAAGVYFVSNQSETRIVVEPGIRGLSNALLDTPWPKVERGKVALARALHRPEPERDAVLLEALADRQPPPDDELPATGLPAAFERALACPFIHAPERGYGTRCTTLLTIERDGSLRMRERRYDASGKVTGETLLQA
jgi:uncharacterized protein with NRDE domain